jgi:hypothetical protein
VSAGRYLVWLAPGLGSGRVLLPGTEFALPPAFDGEGAVFVASASGAVLKLPGPLGPGAAASLFFDVGEPVVMGPMVDGSGTVVVWTASGACVAVDRTGRPRRWDLQARNPSPAAVDRTGALIFATKGGAVYGRR